MSNLEEGKTPLIGEALVVYRRRWYILALFSFLALYQCCVWNTWGPVVNSVQVSILLSVKVLKINGFFRLGGTMKKSDGKCSDCVWMGHGHSLFVRQLGLHCIPGIHGPHPLSSGKIYIDVLQQGKLETSRILIFAQLCSSPLVLWLWPPLSVVPSLSFLVSQTGEFLSHIPSRVSNAVFLHHIHIPHVSLNVSHCITQVLVTWNQI